MTKLAELQTLLDRLPLGPQAPIELSDLSPELQARLAHKPRLIQLQSPSGIRRDIPEAAHIPDFLKMVDDLLLRHNLFLVGPAGTGKTTLAEALARALSRESLTLNCSQWTSPIEIIGGQTIEGYQEGKMIRAWQEGKLLILDELPKLDPNTAGLLNDALAKASSEKATIFNAKGEPIAKHPDFGLIATGNTTGKGSSVVYGGNHQQDASLIDRFSGSYYWVGFNEDLERALIFPKVFEICLKIRAEILRLQAEEIMTLRTMLNFNRVYLLEMERETGKREAHPQGKRLTDALESYFRLMPENQAQLIREKIDYATFVNTYRDQKAFLKEYEKRVQA